MKIWIFNHVALKPNESGITRHYDLAHRMGQKGHDVTVFASSFLAYFFKFRDPKRKNYSEQVNNVLFEWVWTMPYNGNGIGRILNMISYFFMVIFRSFSKKEKPDVVVGSSVHLFACFAAYFVAKTKGAKYIVEIRDLWPRTLIDFGAMSEKHPAALLFGWLERFSYKHAEKIIVTLPGAPDYIESLGFDRNKIHYIPNGIDMSRLEDLERQPSLIHKINEIREKHKYIVMYVGAHGVANSLETVVQSAFNVDPKSYAYVFIGEGPEKLALKGMAKGHTNIYFLDSIPKDEVLPTLELADCLVISMLNTSLYRFGISLNKLNDYLLVGKPVVFAGNVKNNIIEDAKAGMTIEPENAAEMARAVQELCNLSDKEKVRITNNARAYVDENHNIEKLAEKFLAVCGAREYAKETVEG